LISLDPALIGRNQLSVIVAGGGKPLCRCRGTWCRHRRLRHWKVRWLFLNFFTSCNFCCTWWWRRLCDESV